MRETMREQETRRPTWLYGVGHNPDPRFSLANERTLLAWIRTSAAFAVGGGAALLARELVGRWASAVSIGAFGLALTIVIGAIVRWARIERSLRTGEGIPSPWLAGLVVGALIAGAIIGLVVTIVTMS